MSQNRYTKPLIYVILAE